MTNKTNIGFVILIISLLAATSLMFYSYLNAKETAQAFVGPVNLKYFPLSKVKIGGDPMIGDYAPVWVVEFSHRKIFDADIEVYISLLGEIVLTNPADLEEKLREAEKLDVHPYSEKGVKERYGD